jgi:hypothetical protein
MKEYTFHIGFMPEIRANYTKIIEKHIIKIPVCSPSSCLGKFRYTHQIGKIQGKLFIVMLWFWLQSEATIFTAWLSVSLIKSGRVVCKVQTN